MASTALDVARTLPRRALRWLKLGTLPCLSWAIASAAPTVELLRDPWGTLHLFATTETDGFFDLGYAAAEDRSLQMELIRRKAAGRLAEVFGPDWVDADREARIAGHTAYAPRAFAKLPERWQDALRAYAAGVNAWREANPDAVARRFKPLGILPEPWTPADCLLTARGILSLFRMITLDNRSDMFAAVRAGAPLAAPVYFVSFILLGTMIMLNLFIGIIMNSMSEMHAEIGARDRARHVKELGQATMVVEFNRLEQQLDALKEQAATLKVRLVRELERGGNHA
jgi:hypothetical protein